MIHSKRSSLGFFALGAALFALPSAGLAQPSPAEHQPGPAQQQEAPGHSHQKASPHRGHVVMTEEFHLELVFQPAGLRVYMYDGAQNPLSAKGVSGTATILKRNGKPETAELVYKQEESQQDYLEASYSFDAVQPGNAKVTLELAGLSGQKETSIRQSVKYTGLTDASSAGQPPASHQEGAGTSAHEGHGAHQH